VGNTAANVMGDVGQRAVQQQMNNMYGK
jgi:hypothetical protein